jgi:hypothetical protein
MKNTLYLLSILCVSAQAYATPANLLVETTITEHHETGGRDVLKVPPIYTESGKQAVVQVGKLEYTVTPALLDDGTIDLRAVLTERNGDKADVLAAPTIKTKIGQVAEIRIGDLAIETKTSVAK